MQNNEIQYKAYRFRMEANKTTFAYEVKRVRALWDPTLSIPGTGRRGGWRCPVGTRYGGQITDRFGRNCGWGVARRIANAITNIGDRLENVDDRRRGRRVSKRNRRMVARLQRNAEAGRVEEGLRGVADRLDGGDGDVAETLTPSRTPDVDAPDVDTPEETPKPRTRRVRNTRKPPGQLGRGWRGVLDPNGRRYWERDNRGWFDGSDGDVDVPEGSDTPDGGMPSTPDAESATPTRPGAGRRRREEVVLDDDLGGRRRPRRRETLEDIFYGPDFNPPKRDGREPGEIVFVDGKPYKWEANPNANLIGAGPQRKGGWVPASATDLENDRLYKKRLRNRDGKKPRGAPDPEGKRYLWTDEEGDQWEYDPRNDRWSLQGNITKRREAEKKDEEDRKKQNERLRQRNEERQREQQAEQAPFDSDARDAGLRESERRRVRREIEEPGAPRTEDGATPQAEEQRKPRKPRKRRVQASDQRAQESATRRPDGEASPAGTQKKPTERIDLTEDMVELDLAPGESAPDERSFRNVNNRFPKNGLPDSAYWRDEKYDGNDKAELERRFGRYYGGDNNINNRGKVVNQELKRRRDAGEIKPARRKKKPEQPDADKPQFDLPSQPPLPPFMPGTQLDEEVRKVQKALDDIKRIAQDIDREEKDFPNLFERPWWRDTQGNGLGDEDRAKIEAALGQFYDGSGKLNARGRQIYNQIAELKKNEAPEAPEPEDSPMSRANSADDLINAIGMGWRQLDDGERNIIRKEFADADVIAERIKPMDDQQIAALRSDEDVDRFTSGMRNIILDHQRNVEKLMKGMREGRTTRGGELGVRRKNENLAAVARIQHDIARRRNLIARAERKKQDGFLVEAPELPVAEAPSPSEAVGKLDGGEVAGEGIIPRGGALDGLTREALRADVQKKAQDLEREYEQYAENLIQNNNADVIRQERNRMDTAVGQWTEGYRAAKELLDEKLKRHEGKKLDGLPQEEQKQIKDLINNLNSHAIQIRALQKVVERYDRHLDNAPLDPESQPYDGVGPMIPNEPSPIRRPLNPQITNYEDAVKAVHQGNQGVSIDDVADEIIVDVMLDENLIAVGDMHYDKNTKITKEDLQTQGFSRFMTRNGEMENARFTFKLVKEDGFGNGVWDVVQVRDKKTGETWFLKATVYGHNGAMLEGIGMRAAEALQLGNDKAHLRIGAEVTDVSTGKRHRWMMMRGIMDWDNPARVVPQQKWADVAKMGFDPNASPSKISPEDAARIAVLDFVFKNNDRHHGNFMYNIDQNGQVRLGLIDHGLIGYGRGIRGKVEERDANPPTPEQWEAEVEKHNERLRRGGIDGYQMEPNDGISGLRNLGFRHQSQEQRQRFARIVERSVRVLEKQLEKMLSEEDLQKAGMKLSPAEKAHLNALRKIVKARLEYLRTHQADLVRKFNP